MKGFKALDSFRLTLIKLTESLTQLRMSSARTVVASQLFYRELTFASSMPEVPKSLNTLMLSTLSSIMTTDTSAEERMLKIELALAHRDSAGICAK